MNKIYKRKKKQYTESIINNIAFSLRHATRNCLETNFTYFILLNLR